GGGGQPEVEQRHEALPACDELGIVAVLGQQRQRLIQGARPLQLQRRWLHKSSQMRCGVAGRSTRSTPSASATALAIAAGALIVVPSPSPFAPSGVSGEGDSRCAETTRGSSVAVGGR